VRDRVWRAAREVFERRAPLLDHARETLEALRTRGLKLALVTKGDPDVQRARIEQSGLAPLFDVVEIVDRKTPEAIAAVVERLGVAPDTALSVGNSVRSDVLPSLAAGLRPVWIDAHVWEFERDHDVLAEEQVIEVGGLDELLELVTP
jgi:putative hydrolase of the HAD superfamily